MHKNCPKTCGVCDGDVPVTTVTMECKDRIDKCKDMKPYCGNAGAAYLDKLCPVTCGTCPDENAVTPVASTVQTSVVMTIATEASSIAPMTTQPPSTVKTEMSTQETKQTTEAAETCVDKTPEKCTKQLCSMPGPKKKAFVKENCHKTCNLCGKKPESTNENANCVDLKPNACKNFYSMKCNNPGAQAFVNLNCRKTCNKCDTTAPSTE